MWFIKFWLRWFVSIIALAPAGFTYWLLLTQQPNILHTLNEGVGKVLEQAIEFFNIDPAILVWTDLLVSNEKIVFAFIWIAWMLFILMCFDLIRQHLFGKK